jgi:Asp/Glu/hydantoin racemase
MAAPRIALIHALKHSPPPIEAAFAASWPEPRLMNLLDDSLSADLARDGVLTPAMTQRFVQLGRYAAATGADAILFTCSAFGPCIEAVARDLKIPVLKPNEAMVEEAEASGGTVGLIATFAPTLASMPAEFPPAVSVRTCMVEGALPALDRGDAETHDRLVGRAAEAVKDCDVIALAQFSLARSAQLVAQATGKRVLTTPDSAVRKLRRLLEGA